MLEDDQPTRVPRANSSMFGESGFARAENDFYETPAWCSEVLLDWYYFGVTPFIWEPAAGKGAITDVLMARSIACCTSDLIRYEDGPPGGGQDFLAFRAPLFREVTAIVTNPPYLLATEFVTHAIALMQPVRGIVAMLLRHEWDCASSRTALFDREPFACKLTLTKRPRWAKGDNGAPRFNFAWFIWDWTHEGPAVLRYGPNAPRRAGARQGTLL